MSKRYFEANSRPKPGVVSEELRRALGIHRDKLPIWIYRMRVLGYPPGYLATAKVNTLSIFDGTNNGLSGEDGEIDEHQYNKESFVEYPGFNIPVPEGVRDDWYYLRMPPMLERQQLKEALKSMKVSEPVPYKRTKFDMTSPSTSSTPQTSKHSSNRNSVESLNGSVDYDLNSSKSKLKCSESEDKSDDRVFEESVEEISGNDLFKTPDKPNNSKESSQKLKIISMGSPMPASEQPKRPSLEKWAEGMGELLYFENLPEGYTGVYKNKMKGIIDKIREKNSQT